jgi:ribonuclease HI
LDLYVHGLVERKIATCGLLVWDVGENRLLLEHGRLIAEGKGVSPTFADRCALGEGLNWLIRQGLYRRRIVAYTDSVHIYELDEQGAGERPAQKVAHRPLAEELRELVKRFPQLTLKLISRQENRRASQLAAAAYVAFQEDRRRRRAAEIVDELQRIEAKIYLVGERYKVDLAAGTCTCPDFRRMHTERYPIRCKHLLAAQQESKRSGK